MPKGVTRGIMGTDVGFDLDDAARCLSSAPADIADEDAA